MMTRKNTKKTRKNAKKTKLRKTRSKKHGGAKMPYVGPYYENPSLKLWDGVSANNYKMVESAFKEGADVNIKNDNGAWFLFVAVENDNIRMVNLLLENGIDVNVTDRYNNTALLTAVKNGRSDIVKLLLEKGADINKANNGGETILMGAINYGEEEVIEILLAYDEEGVRVDVNARNNYDGETALIRAVEYGNSEIVATLVEAGADMNIRDNYGNTPLIRASMIGEEYILEVLLDLGADVNAQSNAGDTALIMASRRGHYDIVEMLLASEEEEEEDGTTLNIFYGTDINATNNAEETAIMVARENSHEEIVELLLYAGADDTSIPLPPPPRSRPQTDIMTRLLVRDKVSLEKNENNPFTDLELERFDPILQENVHLCDYVNEDEDNLLFIFDTQFAMIGRSRIKSLISEDTLDKNKIIYQCRTTDQAFRPRDENIIGGPALNMDIIGLFGVMVPLSYLDEVVNGKHQIFVIESTNANKTMPIASLNTRLGGNVVSANHCQAEVAIQVSKLSYVDNDVLIGMCEKKGGNRKSKRRTKKSKKTKRKNRSTRQRR
jgi:ankyrin repeat protein